jgi:hypothetical protein
LIQSSRGGSVRTARFRIHFDMPARLADEVHVSIGEREESQALGFGA